MADYKADEISVKLTARCGYRCSSCLEDSSPDILTERDVSEVIRQAKLLEIKSAYPHGGEVFLRKDMLKLFFSEAAFSGMHVMYLTTGSCWAVSTEKVESAFNELYENYFDPSSTILCPSVDDFHAENKTFVTRTANLIEGYLNFKESCTSFSNLPFPIFSKVVRTKEKNGKATIKALEDELTSRGLTTPKSTIEHLFGGNTIPLKNNAWIEFISGALSYVGNPAAVPGNQKIYLMPYFRNSNLDKKTNTLAVENTGDVKPAIDYPESFGNITEAPLTEIIGAIKNDPVVRFLSSNPPMLLWLYAKILFREKLDGVTYKDQHHLLDILLSDPEINAELKNHITKNKMPTVSALAKGLFHRQLF